MWNYLLRRLVLGVFTLWLVTFLVYGLIRCMPGDPLLVEVEKMGLPAKMSQAEMNRIHEIFGLNDPWQTAYLRWLGRLVRFHLGNSLSRHEPVTSLIGDRIGPTLMISGT